MRRLRSAGPVRTARRPKSERRPHSPPELRARAGVVDVGGDRPQLLAALQCLLARVGQFHEPIPIARPRVHRPRAGARSDRQLRRALLAEAPRALAESLPRVSWLLDARCRRSKPSGSRRTASGTSTRRARTDRVLRASGCSRRSPNASGPSPCGQEPIWWNEKNVCSLPKPQTLGTPRPLVARRVPGDTRSVWDGASGSRSRPPLREPWPRR